jgi:hypothetical protein
MRSGFGLCVLALTLAACSDDGPGRLAAQWGCGPVGGLKAISGERPPAWVLVGEFTETREAPAAVAEIACNLATSGKTLFVGVSQYLGGDTDAETRLRARLAELIQKGAPIVVGTIGGDDHPYDVHARDRAEKTWASNIMAMVRKAEAERALLFVSRADAMAATIAPTGDRFSGYSPMATFLTGDVVSLEVAANPIPGAQGPEIRLHRQMQDGFHGQLALQSLTRPMIALAMPEHREREAVLAPADKAARESAEKTLREAQERIQSLLDRGSVEVAPDTDRLLEELGERLPEYEAE